MGLLESVVVSFVSIFIIMDPFASLPPFLAFMRRCKDADIKDTANKAILIAAALAVIFIFSGVEILKILSITLSDFKIAGGIVLVLLGLESVLNFSFSNHKNEGGGLDSVAVLIATPLLTGPGLITTLVVLVDDFGLAPVLIALTLALLLSWLILRNAISLKNVLGERFILILCKVIALLLIALGVSYIKSGILG